MSGVGCSESYDCRTPRGVDALDSDYGEPACQGHWVDGWLWLPMHQPLDIFNPAAGGKVIFEVSAWPIPSFMLTVVGIFAQ